MKKAAKISPFRLTSLLRLQKNPTLALHLFQNPNPQSTNPPFRHSAQSYDIILSKLARARMFTQMHQILAQMQTQTRFTPKEAIFCTIISSYGRARMPESALRTFLLIPSFCPPTIRSFNTLLNILLRQNHLPKLQHLCQTLNTSQFSPDACTYNILIRAKAASGSIQAARQLFDEMSLKKIRPTITTFSTIISALAESEAAFRVKEEMVQLHNVKPNAFIYTTLVKLLCKENEIDRAIALKDEIASENEVLLDAAIYTTLIRGLFRAGRKGEVVAILEEMRRRKVGPETATYNAIIAGFSDEGDFDACLEALEEMRRRGCEPDLVSYNTIVVGMCRVGRWRDAREVFEDMPRKGCRPDVVTYRALFDGICVGGEGWEVEEMVEEMVFSGYYPTEGSFRKLVEGVLVGGCFGVGEMVDLLSCDG